MCTGACVCAQVSLYSIQNRPYRILTCTRLINMRVNLCINFRYLDIRFFCFVFSCRISLFSIANNIKLHLSYYFIPIIILHVDVSLALFPFFVSWPQFFTAGFVCWLWWPFRYFIWKSLFINNLRIKWQIHNLFNLRKIGCKVHEAIYAVHRCWQAWILYWRKKNCTENWLYTEYR